MGKSMTKSKNEKTNQKKSMSRHTRKPAFSTSPSQELKKVTWPNRDTLLKSTVLILIIIIVLTIYISGLDVLLSKLFTFLRATI